MEYCAGRGGPSPPSPASPPSRQSGPPRPRTPLARGGARHLRARVRGLRGDRYFDFKTDYKGQVTFFSLEVFDELCGALQVQGIPPSAVRRNIYARDVDLNSLIGQDFEAQGVRFHGTEESRPCDWMNRAIVPGAKEFLKGRGGLRARILTDGILRSAASVPAAIE